MCVGIIILVKMEVFLPMFVGLLLVSDFCRIVRKVTDMLWLRFASGLTMAKDISGSYFSELDLLTCSYRIYRQRSTLIERAFAKNLIFLKMWLWLTCVFWNCLFWESAEDGALWPLSSFVFRLMNFVRFGPCLVVSLSVHMSVFWWVCLRVRLYVSIHIHTPISENVQCIQKQIHAFII